MMNLFLEGIQSAGEEVELIYVQDLDIKPCRGCFTCWTKTPGKCIIKDDMESILHKIANADIVVYGTPVYVDGMTSTLKALMDRSIPLVEGTFVLRDDHCRHPPRETTKTGKTVLLSVSGFTELDNFEPLVTQMKAAAKNMNAEFVGSILRPCAWLVPTLKENGVPVDDIYEAIIEAGRQLVKDGKFSEETLAIISREVMPRDSIIELVNKHSNFH